MMRSAARENRLRAAIWSSMFFRLVGVRRFEVQRYSLFKIFNRLLDSLSLAGNVKLSTPRDEPFTFFPNNNLVLLCCRHGERLSFIVALISPSEMRPKLRLRHVGVAALVTRLQRAAVEDVALQPDLCGEVCADGERVAAERAAVDEHFELEPFEVNIDPAKLAARNRVAERLEREDAARQRPVVLVRGARRRGHFERVPARPLGARRRDAGAVGESAKPDVQLLRAEAFGADLGQVLKLEEDFRLVAVAVAVDDGLAVLVVLGERPRANALHVARAEAGAAVGVENLARARLVEHRPDFETFAELPGAPVQHRAAAAELRRLALVARALGEVVEVLLARNFETDCFERLFHREAVGGQHSAFSFWLSAFSY